MNVLVLGANGMLGPHVVKELQGKHTLRLSDINDLETEHEYLKVDVSDLDQVVAAAEGMDAIINLSVLRTDRKLAFDVSARGSYNMMRAAVEHDIRPRHQHGPPLHHHGADLRAVRPSHRARRPASAGDLPVRAHKVPGAGDMPRFHREL